MVITALIFLFAPLTMSWPMMASGLGFLDALFETISGCTTTGLTTIATVADKPETFLFARAWMQWVGGLGIVVLSLAIMIQPGLVAKRHFNT
jgi:trk system potassium uptake protein TrkH